MKLERDLSYWDMFATMVIATVFSTFFVGYTVSQTQTINKGIGASGAFLFGLVTIASSKNVRKDESFIRLVEDNDETMFINNLVNAAFPEPENPMLPPEPPQPQQPKLPVAGVTTETPEQVWAKAECPAHAAKNPQKKQLWDYLAATHPEILMLLQRQLLLVFGEQGSGKTTFVAFLITLRKLYLNHEIWVADPHANDNHDLWVASDTITGYGWDYEGIGKQIDVYFERLQVKDKYPITAVWDEYTNYDSRIEGGDKGFVQSALADARKALIYNIMISHGDTNAAQGGSKGTSKMRERGQTSILLLGEPDPLGQVRPRGLGTISGLFKDNKGKPLDTPITVEEWMNPAYLVSLFPELKDKVSPTQKMGKKHRKKETLDALFEIVDEHNPSMSGGNSTKGAAPPAPPIAPPVQPFLDDNTDLHQTDGAAHQPAPNPEWLHRLLHQPAPPAPSLPIEAILPPNWHKIDADDLVRVFGADTSLLNKQQQNLYLTVRALIVESIRYKMGKTKTLLAIFNVSKGSNKSYLAACALYDKIKAEIQ